MIYEPVGNLIFLNKNGMMGMMGMGNMTEADIEHVMSMNICFPMMGEEMGDGMMGMNGMMGQRA